MKNGHGSKFGRKKEAAIAALFSGKSQADAARVVGIDPSTMKRWMRLPEFQAEFLQVRRDALNLAHARTQYIAAALLTLGYKLATDAATPASVKAHLILGLMDRADRSLEQDDILVRLAALERSNEEKKKG
jgi:transposase-like protein